MGTATAPTARTHPRRASGGSTTRSAKRLIVPRSVPGLFRRRRPDGLLGRGPLMGTSAVRASSGDPSGVSGFPSNRPRTDHASMPTPWPAGTRTCCCAPVHTAETSPPVTTALIRGHSQGGQRYSGAPPSHLNRREMRRPRMPEPSVRLRDGSSSPAMPRRRRGSRPERPVPRRWRRCWPVSCRRWSRIHRHRGSRPGR